MTIQRWTAIVGAPALIAGLAACAPDFAWGPGRDPADEYPQGVFTGELVGGLPLYRFPTIVVVGSRSSMRWRSDSD